MAGYALLPLGRDFVSGVKNGFKGVKLQRCCLTGRIMSIRGPLGRIDELEPHVHFETINLKMHHYLTVKNVHKEWKNLLGDFDEVEVENTIVFEKINEKPLNGLTAFEKFVDIHNPHQGALLNVGVRIESPYLERCVLAWDTLNTRMFELPPFGYAYRTIGLLPEWVTTNPEGWEKV
jgi:hypothetical protein